MNEHQLQAYYEYQRGKYMDDARRARLRAHILRKAQPRPGIQWIRSLGQSISGLLARRPAQPAPLPVVQFEDFMEC